MREIGILQELYQNNDYFPIEYFMDMYGVSKRTIQNDIAYLTRISKDKGFHLLQQRTKGYLLEVLDEHTFCSWLEDIQKYVQKPNISIDNVIAVLALQETYITLEDIADWLRVSRSILKKYRDDVRVYVTHYQLTLESKVHYGFRIIEPLLLRRNLLFTLYMNHNEIIINQIDEVVNNQFYFIEENLVSLLKERDLIINYIELKEITIWLRITIYIHLRLQTPKCKKGNHPLFDNMQSVYGVGYDKQDVKLFEELIVLYTRTKQVQAHYYNELQFTMNTYLINIDKQYNTHFNQDKDFIKLLISHISSLINRSHYKISYKNPIIDEIVIKYPMIFNMVIDLSKILENTFDITINKDEMGFMVTHFAVHMEKEIGYRFAKFKIAIVCSTGGGSAYLIKLKLAMLFTNSNIRTFSLLQMEELQAFIPDIVFSISELNIKLDVPILYIKELLDDYDILRIKQLLMFDDIGHDVSMIKNKNYIINNLFNPHFFSIEDTIEDYIDCLKNMAICLENAGIGGDNYSQMVLERETFCSTIYLHGVAIAHPVEMRANQDVVAIKILKKPFVHQGRQVSLIFMVALTKKNLMLHKEISSDVFAIMNQYSLVKNLRKARSYHQFIAILNGKV